MALAATIEWEVRTTATASNANGGGYKPGASGTDFSQQNAAQYNLTGVTTAAADAILLSASAAADMVGNIANITGGTNFTVGRYEIISVVAGVSITVDRTCTSAAGALGVVNIGGALSLGSSDDAVFEAFVAGNKVHIQSGSYTIGGNVSVANDATAVSPVNIVGYNSARDDSPLGASRPTLAFGANTAVFAGNYYNFGHIIFTTTAAAGLSIGVGAIVRHCKVTNSSGSVGRSAIDCTEAGTRVLFNELSSTAGNAVDAGGGAGNGTHIIGNYIHDSTAGIITGTAEFATIAFNIIDTCTTGIQINSGVIGIIIINNTLYNGTTGISLPATTGTRSTVLNNIISTFTTGASANALTDSNYFDYNNFHNNGTARTNVTAGAGDIALDPSFTNAASGDFTVGANMKAVAFPGIFSGALTTGYLDIGAVQRVEPTGGSGGGIRLAGHGGLAA